MLPGGPSSSRISREVDKCWFRNCGKVGKWLLDCSIVYLFLIPPKPAADNRSKVPPRPRGRGGEVCARIGKNDLWRKK